MRLQGIADSHCSRGTWFHHNTFLQVLLHRVITNQGSINWECAMHAGPPISDETDASSDQVNLDDLRTGQADAHCSTAHDAPLSALSSISRFAVSSISVSSQVILCMC